MLALNSNNAAQLDTSCSSMSIARQYVLIVQQLICCIGSAYRWCMSRHTVNNSCYYCCCCCWSDVCAADFPSAPNLTAAAAAQKLEWAPVTVQDLSSVSYSLSQDAGSTTTLLNMTVTAKLGVAGSITDVTTPGTSSGRRSLLSSSTSVYQHVCLLYGRINVTVLGILSRRPALQCVVVRSDAVCFCVWVYI